MAGKVFLDTAYAIALASSRDMFHERALELAAQLHSNQTSLITTRAISLEIGNALARQRYRHAAVRLLLALETDPQVEIIPLTEPLFLRALQLFEKRADKEWGLSDCISFVVMGDEGITDALTTDGHFRQAGYKALLLE
jgi:uncharacterized protein